MEKLCISVKEASQILGISRPKVYEHINRRDFPYFKDGTRTLIPLDSLKEWIARESRN